MYGTQQRNRHVRKQETKCSKREQAITFDSSNVGRFFWSWILKDYVEVQEKKKKVIILCSRPLQDVKLSIFTSYSCSEGKENRETCAKLFFCQSKPIPFLPFSLTSRSSLLKLPNNWHLLRWTPPPRSRFWLVTQRFSLTSNLRSKRFRVVSEKRKTQERGLTLVPRYLLRNRTETLAMQATQQGDNSTPHVIR